MSGITPGEEFIRNLVKHQNSVYGYLLSLVPDADRARDLLQDVSAELWLKSAEFAPGTNFLAWACRVAHF